MPAQGRALPARADPHRLPQGAEVQPSAGQGEGHHYSELGTPLCPDPRLQGTPEGEERHAHLVGQKDWLVGLVTKEGRMVEL